MRVSEERSLDRLREHYLIERELADRLRAAPANERLGLYASVYDELFQRVSDHPQHVWKGDPEARLKGARDQLDVLAPYTRPGETFLEVGAGDCAVSLEAARTAGHVWAVDVSEEITGDVPKPENFDLVISDGVSIPVAPSSIDLAYSNQLMEHLHPDDAHQQLLNIHTALAPGGTYVCVTPNRLYGPSDISSYFDHHATGFHLKEYTVGELSDLCHAVGFKRTRTVVWLRWRGFALPCWIPATFERLLERLPRGLSKRLARSEFRRLLGITLVAHKT